MIPLLQVQGARDVPSRARPAATRRPAGRRRAVVHASDSRATSTATVELTVDHETRCGRLMSARGAGPGPARYTRPRPAFVVRKGRPESDSRPRARRTLSTFQPRRSTSAQAERSSMTTCSSIEWRPAPRGPKSTVGVPAAPEDGRVGPETHALEARLAEAGAGRGGKAGRRPRVARRRIGGTRQQQANVSVKVRIVRGNLAARWRASSLAATSTGSPGSVRRSISRTARAG